MSRRNLISASILIAVFSTLVLLPSALLAQKGPQSTEGAPLKGVDVKLGKNPGGSPAARTTDGGGKFDFGTVPAGSYYLTVSLREGSSENAMIMVTVEGAAGGTIQRKVKPAAPTAKAGEGDRIILESDGKHPITGACTTIIKSKSNITNN